jgi:hypothetical protein
METPSVNPIYVALGFILRCLIPLLIMLGISYLLRRFGLISEQSKPNETNHNNHATPGGIAP